MLLLLYYNGVCFQNIDFHKRFKVNYTIALEERLLLPCLTGKVDAYIHYFS